MLGSLSSTVILLLVNFHFILNIIMLLVGLTYVKYEGGGVLDLVGELATLIDTV